MRNRHWDSLDLQDKQLKMTKGTLPTAGAVTSVLASVLQGLLYQRLLKAEGAYSNLVSPPPPTLNQLCLSLALLV